MMTYTEEEAREKWCPFARLMDCLPNNEFCVTANRTDVNDEFGERFEQLNKCIASDCMAWRKARIPKGIQASVEGGYCGLAGRLSND